MSKIYSAVVLLVLPLVLSAQLSNISEVTLSFVPMSGSSVTATATDSGNGLMADGAINLSESTNYTLSVVLRNGATDITNEVRNNAGNYQLFFVTDEGVFDGAFEYVDSDSGNLPVGLATDWTSGCVEEENISGSFRVVLRDLTGVKDNNSTLTSGSGVFDISWDITIQEDPEAPDCENEEEVIDRVTLTFTPTAGGDPIVAVASDPDGPGPMDLQVEDISLAESTEYELSIMLENTIEGEDITEEIMEEDDEHQFFFAFGEDLFDTPNGDGNIDNSDDPVNYNDQDDNDLPVGLSTTWTTACTEDANVSNTFRVVLKHQPGIKSANTGFEDGGTDIDISWNLTVVDDPDAPECENEEEVIDRVTLTFTPTAGGDPIVAVASDPDGPGPQDLQVEDINLDESTDYELSITLENTIEGEDITEEIMEEDDEHLFLFAFGEDLFEDPDGDGNVDNRMDPIGYLDQDDNNLPVGLSTEWTTACTEEGNVSNTFRVVLKHQPDVKSATSGFEDGGTDIDITWNVTVVDDPAAPECENEEEVIDRVTLTFTPAAGGDPIVAVASDPDGPGPMGLQVEDITLAESTVYGLTIQLENTIEGEDITEEIMEEDDEHQFFFAFGEDLFDDPDGDGNIDDSSDPIGYTDMDDNGLPVGLSTAWITACTEEGDVTNTFRVVLKHQPGIKSANTGFNDGGTDIDITWNMTIADDPDAPECENEEETIDQVTLTFTPTDGGDPIVAIANDPDGPGPQDLQVEDIDLVQNTTYELSIMLENTMEGEDITEEIEEEDDEHQFFFAWTGDIFSDPMGDGNIDSASDPVNYNDQDDNGLPVGLSTDWTTNVAMSAGTFRVVLKHQPGIKTAMTTAEDGGTDIDITWNVNAVITSLDNLAPTQKLEIAPNPVSSMLMLQVENLDIDGELFGIYNSTGQLMRTFRMNGTEVEVGDLAPGLYLLKLQGERVQATRRFIKR